MRKLFYWVVTFVCCLGLFSCSKPAVEKKTEKPSFLFVIQAKTGQIIKEGKTSKLIMNTSNLDKMIMFSDCPLRYHSYSDNEKLKQIWIEGDNSFEKDPPNAVLTAAGQKAEIKILTSISVKGDTVTIGLKNEPTMPAGEVKDLTLVIDNVYCSTKKECIADGVHEIVTDALSGQYRCEHGAE